MYSLEVDTADKQDHTLNILKAATVLQYNKGPVAGCLLGLFVLFTTKTVLKESKGQAHKQ